MTGVLRKTGNLDTKRYKGKIIWRDIGRRQAPIIQGTPEDIRS